MSTEQLAATALAAFDQMVNASAGFRSRRGQRDMAQRLIILRGDKWYKVPAWLLSSIDNCITEKPQRDEFDRFIGTRPMKRFPYETFRG